MAKVNELSAKAIMSGALELVMETIQADRADNQFVLDEIGAIFRRIDSGEPLPPELDIDAEIEEAAKAVASLPSTPSKPIRLMPTPYTIISDTREQRPYIFAMPLKRTERLSLQIQHCRGCLPSGDYSIHGHETTVAVERKSLADLFSTLGQGRRRFQNELERLSQYKISAVVVEAEWGTIFRHPPSRSRLNPKTIFFSVLAWIHRFPQIHWMFVDGRSFGEAATALFLDRYWRENCEGKAAEQAMAAADGR